MSQNSFCKCPPEEQSGWVSQKKGDICPRCQGGRPIAGELLPSPAKRSREQSGLTEFPVLKLDPPPHPESSAKFQTANSEPVSPAAERADKQRQTSYEAEQKKITRLLAVAILLWTLFSLLPGGVAWRSWLGDWSASSFPLWIPLFGAMGIGPLLLGILLWQVPDWGTLKSVAGGLLTAACGYAFAATLFGLSGPDSRWLAWLDFPQSDAAAATLWCSCMLVLAATLSLICFLEGQRWQRVEQLFTELGNRSDTGAAGSGS